MDKYIVASIFVAIGLIIYGGYVSRCHGEECKIKEENNQIHSDMTPENISNLLEGDKIVLLDVREDYEWEEGHITGAKHITLSNLNSTTTKDLPKDKPIYIYCRSGNRAGQAELILKNLGFDKALNIGGINQWQENGGKLVQ